MLEVQFTAIDILAYQVVQTKLKSDNMVLLTQNIQNKYVR